MNFQLCTSFCKLLQNRPMLLGFMWRNAVNESAAREPVGVITSTSVREPISIDYQCATKSYSAWKQLLVFQCIWWQHSGRIDGACGMDLACRPDFANPLYCTPLVLHHAGDVMAQLQWKIAASLCVVTHWCWWIIATMKWVRIVMFDWIVRTLHIYTRHGLITLQPVTITTITCTCVCFASRNSKHHY